MNKQEKEDSLKTKLTLVKNNLEIANRAILLSIESFDNLDDFMDLINNWKFYKGFLKK